MSCISPDDGFSGQRGRVRHGHIGVTNTSDSGAALIVDGQVVAAANEERFVRKKLVRCFPAESIAWVLSSQGLEVRDVGSDRCMSTSRCAPTKVLPPGRPDEIGPNGGQ